MKFEFNWPSGHYRPIGGITIAYSHRTTGCFDDRLLTRMTDTGFLVA